MHSHYRYKITNIRIKKHEDLEYLALSIMGITFPLYFSPRIIKFSLFNHSRNGRVQARRITS